ncbi:hypothetical protein S40293_09455 [Stachybotrys chartarum IBT 40293]|nr:hypothetical protein S40293_09455 [Stachybotrys chartarum IBT 40293]
MPRTQDETGQQQAVVAAPGQPAMAAEARFAAILADAGRVFRDSSGDNLDYFMNPTITSLDDLKTQLDIENWRFSDYRNRHRKIIDAVAAVVQPVELMGDIVAGAASEVFAPTQSIFSAVLFLVNAANNVSASYDRILDLFDQLKDFTARLEVYVKNQLSPALRNKVVEILAALFNVLVLAIKEVRQGRFRAFFKRLFDAGSPIQPAMQKLEALTLGESRQVLTDTYGEVLEINTRTGRVEDAVSQVNENLMSLRAENLERANRTYQDRIREVLEPSPFPEDFYTYFNKSRVAGTGDWLLADEGLTAWLEGETRYLWVSGNLGTGKSFLTARVISNCTDQAYRVGYFFFRDTDPETRSVTQALRDVAYQLSESDAYYAKMLTKTAYRPDEIRTVSSAFRKLFREPFESSNQGPRMYVFLDGIDEADQEDMQQLLELLAPQDETDETVEESRVQFALVGRTHLSERVTFALDPSAIGNIYITIQITTSRNAEDVRKFVIESIVNERIMSRTAPEFKDDVIDAIVKQADGLFILAKLMLAEVHRKRHPRSILQSVKQYPQETNAMLQQTLDNLTTALSAEAAEDLNEMLRWVVWAQETLSLAELEEILVLEFGDKPFKLEEALRGPYACFFELEREDGQSTDDLVKDFERFQRQSIRNVEHSPLAEDRIGRPSHSDGNSPHGISIPRGRITSPRGRLSSFSSDRRRGSHSRNRAPQRNSTGTLQRTSPKLQQGGFSPTLGQGAFLPGTPPRYFSPASPASPSSDSEYLYVDNEIEYGSNKDTTLVTIFHSSVRQFFQSQDPPRPRTGQDKGRPCIGFDNVEAKVHILNTCLSIFTDGGVYDRRGLGKGKSSLKQYAAWYWQEHVRILDPTLVSSANKRLISTKIHKMLTDEAIILEWTLLYERSNEGLEVLSDANIAGLRRWMSDEGVLASLDPDARSWAQKASSTNSGITQQIGRLWAKAWLSEDFEQPIPTKFCFEIVQSLAYMDSGNTWFESKCNWSEVPAGQRILKAVKWAGIPETAHWHRRVGSTFLTQGLHKEALSYYQEALKLDGHDVQTMGRIAWCLWVDGQYEQSLSKALTCADIEIKYIAEGGDSALGLSRSKSRLYLDYLLIARCNYRLGMVDASLEYFQKAMEAGRDINLKPSEKFVAEASYLEVLAAENRHKDMFKVLETLSTDYETAEKSHSRVIDFFLDQYNKTLLLDWIPRAACKAEKVELLLRWLEEASDTALESFNHLKNLWLRLSCGMTYAYSQNTHDAIAVFEPISLYESRTNGNVPTRQGRAVSFQRLAALYKNQVLQAGLETDEAATWITKLEDVQQKQNNQSNSDMPSESLGSDINIASIYLALFYRLLHRQDEAKALLRDLVLASFELLSDSEPQNDEYALANLLRLFIAADDIENASALAISMRKVNPRAGLGTPTDSPQQNRKEPKLPEIQSSNRACALCLNIMSLSEQFAMCKFCLDSYCVSCLETRIKQPGNKTSDHKEELVCKSDHDWFMVEPLNRRLHRGEILFGDGQVRGFAEWKTELEERWGGSAVMLK